MIEKIKNILIIILLVTITIIAVISTQKSKDYREVIKEGEKTEQELRNKNDSLQNNIDSRDLYIVHLEKDIKKIDSLANESLKTADYYKSLYELLYLDEGNIPETTEDSLKVCLKGSRYLLKENTSLREVIIQKDTVISIQGKVISNLKLNVEDYKIQLDNEKQVSEMWRTHAESFEQINKKEKFKAFLKGLGIGTGVGAAVIIILVI